MASLACPSLEYRRSPLDLRITRYGPSSGSGGNGVTVGVRTGVAGRRVDVGGWDASFSHALRHMTRIVMTRTGRCAWNPFIKLPVITSLNQLDFRDRLQYNIFFQN